MLPFHDAVRFAQSLNLQTQKEWNAWCKAGTRPVNIPPSPQYTYNNHDASKQGYRGAPDWQGWDYWLGNYKTDAAPGPKGDVEHYIPFQAAVAYARTLKLGSATEWATWRTSGSRPKNIPANPAKIYKDHGWQG